MNTFQFNKKHSELNIAKARCLIQQFQLLTKYTMVTITYRILALVP